MLPSSRERRANTSKSIGLLAQAPLATEGRDVRYPDCTSARAAGGSANPYALRAFRAEGGSLGRPPGPPRAEQGALRPDHGRPARTAKRAGARPLGVPHERGVRVAQV